MKATFSRRTRDAGLAWFLALIASLPALPVLARETLAEQPPTAPALSNEELFRLLSTQTPQPQREALMQGVIAAAQAGSGWDTFLIGVLFRHGPRHPSQIAPQNLEVARDWLQRCVRTTGCPVLALASRAELEIEAGQPEAAVAWAQAYVYALREIGRRFDGGEPHRLSRGYADELLDMAMRGLVANEGDRPPATLFEALKADYGHDLSRMIEEEVQNGREAQLVESPRIVKAPGRHVRALQTVSCSGLYLLQIAPEGGPVRDMVLVEALPNTRFTLALDKHVRSLVYSAAGSGQGDRSAYVFQPMNYLVSKPVPSHDVD